MPIYEVILAIGLGKLLKYTLYAQVVSRFPRYFVRVYTAAMPSMGPTVVEAGVAEERVSSENARKGESHRCRRPTQHSVRCTPKGPMASLLDLIDATELGDRTRRTMAGVEPMIRRP